MPGRRAAAWPGPALAETGWPGPALAETDTGIGVSGRGRDAAAAAAAIQMRETTRRPACRAIRDCGNSGKGAQAVPESTAGRRKCVETVMPETKSLITPGSRRAVKAYIERIMRLKPQVRKTFGFYAAMMAKFCFPTSSRYNALHGPLALAGLVASMAYNQSCGNKAAKLLVLSAVEAAGDDDARIRSAHLPTSQWGLGLIARLDHDRMEGACNAAFHACTDASRRRGMIPERPVGMMDGHSTAYYGKKGDKSFIIKSRKKDGTTKFNVFLSSAIRAGPSA